MMERNDLKVDSFGRRILVENSRIAILSAQLGGYLPISIIPPKSKIPKTLLQFRWHSIPLYWNFFTLGIMFTWTSIYYFILRKHLRFMTLFGPTETFSYALLILVGTSLGIYLRIHAVRNSQVFVQFFEKNANLLERFYNFGLGFQSFIKIEKYINISFSVYFFPLILHVIYVHIYTPLTAYVARNHTWTSDIIYTFGSGTWVLVQYLLISNLWIILFPKIFSACYQEIASDIRHRYPKGFYYGEISKAAFSVEEIENRVKDYINLMISVEEMVDEFNQVFGERLICETIICVVTFVINAFFGCFWFQRGQVRIIIDVATPLYIYGKKFIELGFTCGNISKDARSAMNTLLDHVPFERMSLGLRRKIQLLQIKMESNPPIVSAKQFFVVNKGSVTTVMSGMMAFLVALIQFRQADK